jgi:hypothetical protein
MKRGRYIKEEECTARYWHSFRRLKYDRRDREPDVLYRLG